MSAEVTSSTNIHGSSPAAPPIPSGHRWAGVCGIAFAVLLFISVAAVDAPRAATDAELQSWWGSPGNLHLEVLSSFAFLGAGLCFVVFISYLQARLRVVAPASLATAVLGPAGTAFAAMAFVTGAMGALARGQLIDGEPVPGSDLLRYLPQIRYSAMGVYAMPAAGLAIALSSYLVIRYGGLPRWTCWLGVVCVVIIAGAAALYIGQLAIPALLLWAICVAITILRQPLPVPAAGRG